MKISFTSNKEAMYISVLVYGRSKVGKTRLISTCEAPLMLNVENSVISLADHHIPMVSIRSVKDFNEALDNLRYDEESKQYKTICLDSISELAELILQEEKEKFKDGRLAYIKMQEEVFKILRDLMLLPFDIYVIAQCEKALGQSGETINSPYIPGAKGAMKLPYLFDETFALRETISDGTKEPKALLQCKADLYWEAGDKSGKLSMWEEPDLKEIFQKIRGSSVDEQRALSSYLSKFRKLHKEIVSQQIDKEMGEKFYEELSGAMASEGLEIPPNVKNAMSNVLSGSIGA